MSYSGHSLEGVLPLCRDAVGVFCSPSRQGLKIHLSLRKNKTVKTIRYDWSSLTNRDTSNKYVATVRNKFDTLQKISEIHTPNEEYENFDNVHTEAAAECIPTKPRAKHGFSWETLVV